MNDIREIMDSFKKRYVFDEYYYLYNSTDKPVRTLSDYIKIIINTYSAFELSAPWYRGQHDKNLGLISGINRKTTAENIRHEEKSYFERFKGKGIHYSPPLDTFDGSDWYWYFLMQHYGFPTRLLDWTENALIALYFAIKDYHLKPKSDTACVWILDSMWLNGLRNKGIGLIGSLPLDFIKLQEISNDHNVPFAIDSKYFDKRIALQKSCFTLELSIGENNSGFRNIPRLSKQKDNVSLFQIPILPDPSINYDLLLQELKVCGITPTSIYPNLENLSKELLFDSHEKLIPFIKD